jgi:hypothetical protein
MTDHASRRARTQRGAIAVTATFFALALCGIAVTLFAEVASEKKLFDRGESNLRAFEAAETGLVLAEEEISSRRDPGGDGVGSVTGSYDGARFVVTAVNDPLIADQWTLQARGAQGDGSRQIEVRLRRVPSTIWSYGLLSQNSITISGGGTTDSYDSRLGTYASQATKSDSFGTYASAKGPIGSNGTILLQSAEVRGDSNAGPGYTTTLQGLAKVTGSKASLTTAVAIPDTPLTTFAAAAAVNDNGTWSTTGGTTYNAVTKTLTVVAGNTLTLTKSTYFFSKIVLAGNAKLKIASGPVRVFVTDQVDISGGMIVNATQSPSNLQIYQQPYALPTGYTPSVKTAALAGGSASAFVYYGPTTPVTIAGNSDFFGAIVGKSITSSGGAKLHYDKALVDQMDNGQAPIRRIYWRDLAPPLR